MLSEADAEAHVTRKLRRVLLELSTIVRLESPEFIQPQTRWRPDEILSNRCIDSR